MGSSIIFLVVIAIWAVFLLPDLQTRRHHLAQSRAASRIMGASRVLRRESSFPAAEPDDGSTALPAEPSRVSLTAQPAGQSRPELTSRAEATTSPSEAPTEALDMGTVHSTHEAHGSTAFPSAEKKTPAADAPTDSSKPSKDHKSSRSVKPRKALAWVLAALLLVSLIALPTTLVLSALRILAWWSVGVAVAGLVVALAGLRLRARRRVASRRSRQQPVVGVTMDAAEPAPVEAELPATRPMTEVNRRDVAFDQNAAERKLVEEFLAASDAPQGPTSPPSVPRPVVDDRPGRWTPQAIPRPTYLMKPRAPEGPLVAPNIGAGTGADPFSDLLAGSDEGAGTDDPGLGFQEYRAV